MEVWSGCESYYAKYLSLIKASAPDKIEGNPMCWVFGEFQEMKMSIPLSTSDIWRCWEEYYFNVYGKCKSSPSGKPKPS